MTRAFTQPNGADRPGLGLTVALLGPLAHPWLLVTHAQARTSRRALALVIAAASVLVALIAGEATVRHMIEGRIAGAAQSSLTGSVHVGLGATPALVDLAKGSISTVALTDDGMRTCELDTLDFAAAFSDVTRQNGQIHLSGSQATVAIPTSAMTSLLTRKAPRLGQAAIEPDPANNDLTIALGPGGLVQLDEQVALHGDALQFTPGQATVGGNPVPTSLAQRFTANATFTYALPQLPFDMKPDSVGVDQWGVVLTVHGGAATLAPRSSATPTSNTCR